MSDPFLGEIKLVSWPFAPQGWASCDGRLLKIRDNRDLYAVLGLTYGGDGVNTFALPDLRGRAPMHPGPDFAVGSRGGEAVHSLTVDEMPAHNHPALGAPTANSVTPTGNHWAPADGSSQFSLGETTTMSADAIGVAGLGTSHENQAPYLVLNFIIAVDGDIPRTS